jgi:hypothetical protein
LILKQPSNDFSYRGWIFRFRISRSFGGSGRGFYANASIPPPSPVLIDFLSGEGD